MAHRHVADHLGCLRPAIRVRLRRADSWPGLRAVLGRSGETPAWHAYSEQFARALENRTPGHHASGVAPSAGTLRHSGTTWIGSQGTPDRATGSRWSTREGSLIPKSQTCSEGAPSWAGRDQGLEVPARRDPGDRDGHAVNEQGPAYLRRETAPDGVRRTPTVGQR